MIIILGVIVNFLIKIVENGKKKVELRRHFVDYLKTIGLILLKIGMVIK